MSVATNIRRFLIVAAAFSLLGHSPGLAEDGFIASDIVGTWRTGARNGSWGYVAFGPCGGAYCGTLVSGGGKNVEPKYFGAQIVTGMTWNGVGYDDGRLWDIERDVWYDAKIRVLGRDRIKVSGCVLSGVLCGGQIWRRVYAD